MTQQPQQQQQQEPDGEPQAREWFAGRLPDDWFTGPAEITVDREEITVIGTIAAPDLGGATADSAEGQAAAEGRIGRFREETREARIQIAREAEHRFGRKVAWGVRCGETSGLFTHLAVPVMTRLRQPERLVLDTLVESGVARSRADALAWCVRLVGEHSESWLARLRESLADVRRVRAEDPTA